jgi:hypothetical protein
MQNLVGAPVILFSMAFLQRRAPAQRQVGRLERGLSDVEHALYDGCVHF